MTVAELIAAGVIQPTIDYAAGRMTGEDNQRALMGAVGSTAGMLGGGYSGGLATKSFPGFVAGSVAGRLLGGWAADELDKRLRPNQEAVMLLNHHLNQVPIR